MSARRILVVDDETHITHVVCLKLGNAGYETIAAHDGEEALELALADPPDLVITDLQMPYMSGAELAERLRAEPSTRDVPVIMLTARGYALGADDLARTNIKSVMSKPFSPRQVLELVSSLISGGEECEAA